MKKNQSTNDKRRDNTFSNYKLHPGLSMSHSKEGSKKENCITQNIIFTLGRRTARNDMWNLRIKN